MTSPDDSVEKTYYLFGLIVALNSALSEFTLFLLLGFGLLLAYILTIRLRANGLAQLLPAALLILAYGIYSNAEIAAILSYALLAIFVMASLSLPRFIWPLRVITLLFGLAVALRLAPSFPSIGPVATQSLSDLSGPWSIYGGINKALVGLILLPLVNWPSLNLAEFRRNSLLLIMGPLAIVALAYFSGVAIDIKLSTFTLLFAFANLIYVVIAEEVLFRGLIQQYLCTAITGKYNMLIGLFAASVIFGVAHFAGGVHYVALSICAGTLYGYCYWRLKSIWAAVYAHLTVNLLHILLLQYPLPA